jgi:hypothetical protein
MSRQDWTAFVDRTRSPKAKYRAEPTEVNGIRFASKKEAARYQALLIEQQAGQIRALELQPQFPLHVIDPQGVKVCIGRYLGDFKYVREGQTVIEDAKGMRLPLYVWKRKHVESEYGIQIVEV